MSTPTPTENVAPRNNIVSVSGVISQNLQRGEQRNNIPKSVSQGSNASRASLTERATERANNLKEMTGRIKKLQMQGDNLAERICQVHAEVADLLLRASLLFDPQVVRLMDCQAEIPGEFEDATDANLIDPQWREEMNENYGKMLGEVNEGELQVEMEVDEQNS